MQVAARSEFAHREALHLARIRAELQQGHLVEEELDWAELNAEALRRRG